MLEQLLQKKIFPSPLIIEGRFASEWIQKISQHALCESETACGVCRSCKQVLKGFHPDLIRCEPGVKMEEIRQKMYSLRQRPFESKRRVFALYEFQEANANVQNALLKTFEEPMPYWVILAGVNSKFGLLPTIRSRCLLYRLPEKGYEVQLTELEQTLFSWIETGEELTMQKTIETLVKDRQKAKASFQQLLIAASEKSYPGHWKNLAPHLEELLWGIDRNLNTRLIWDTAWAKSFIEERR